MAADSTESMVKVHSVFNPHDYYRPWQMKGQRQSVGSGCVIEGKRILTNAHVVADQTFLQVQNARQARKYVARLLRVAHECDLALLQVDDDSFFKGTTPLAIGELPHSGDKVSVYGFPQGGSRLAITEGIVSRVENLTYAHSWEFLLCCQTDAPINPGSSGGPVISDGLVVGLAFQAGEGQNVGYVIPPPIINHFLCGVGAGGYYGFPGLGLDYQNMENPGLRRRYELSEEAGGVLVTKVFPGSPARGKIRPDDVILEVDGCPVASDGTVEFRKNERTCLEYAAQRRQIGEEITARIQREGKIRGVKLRLDRPSGSFALVPRVQYETAPTYFILGGVVFTPVTTNLLLEWESIEKAPRELAACYFKDPDEERLQAITAIQVLPDEINVGYDHFVYSIVDAVNGKKVSTMEELARAVDGHRGPVHEVTNEQGRRLVLDRKRVEERTPHILECYRVPRDRSENLVKGGAAGRTRPSRPPRARVARRRKTGSAGKRKP